jgi:hypothetical protein
MRAWIIAGLACGLSIAGARAAEVDDVNAAFLATYPLTCSGAFLEDGSPVDQPLVFAMTYRMPWQDAAEPDRQVTLYQYNCTIGAYNTGHAFFTVTQDDGIKPVQLAQPTFRVTYEGGKGPDSEQNEEVVKAITLTGMTAYPTVANAEVDAATGTIRSNGYWRGIGDASSIGAWQLVEGEFTLVRFEVDASYDGEVNLQTVWDTTEALNSPAN